MRYTATHWTYPEFGINTHGCRLPLSCSASPAVCKTLQESGAIPTALSVMAVVTGQEDVVKPMKRSVVLVSLILPVLMTGCASHTDVHALRADTSALAYQSSVRQQTVAARVQQLRDRVAQFEQSQVETRRGVAQAAATLEALRVQLQRMQGDIQEVDHLAQRGPTGSEEVSATQLADFETRLLDLEQRVSSQ